MGLLFDLLLLLLLLFLKLDGIEFFNFDNNFLFFLTVEFWLADGTLTTTDGGAVDS